MVRPILTVAAACLALAASQAARAECTLHYLGDTPLTVSHGNMHIQTRINYQTVDAVVGLAGDINTVGVDAARTLHLQSDIRTGSRLSGNSLNVIGAGRARKGAEMAVVMKRAATLQIAGATVDNARFGVETAPNAGKGVLIAAPFFRSLDVDFDIAGHRLGLFMTDHDCMKPRAVLSGDMFMTRLREDPHDPSSVISVAIAGHDFDAVLGLSGESEITLSALRALGITPQPAEADGAIPPVTIPAMVVGDITLKNFKMRPIDEIPARSRPDIDLGLHFAEKIHLWISHSSHSLVMQVPPAPSPLPGARQTASGTR